MLEAGIPCWFVWPKKTEIWQNKRTSSALILWKSHHSLSLSSLSTNKCGDCGIREEMMLGFTFKTFRLMLHVVELLFRENKAATLTSSFCECFLTFFFLSLFFVCLFFYLQVIGLLDVFTPATSLEDFNDV